MNWLLIALAAPVLWAITNHIDKFVVAKYTGNKNPASLLIFTCLIWGFAALVIFIFLPIQHVSILQALGGMLAGALLIAGYMPYMHALNEGEVSIAAPLFQIIAPLSYVAGAIFLNETLSGGQIFASLLIVVGAVLLTLNPEKMHWKWRIFKLMLVSSVLITLSIVVFKIIGLDSSFWTASFWSYAGAFVFGILLFGIPLYRKDFISFVREGGRSILGLNVFSEVINIIANLISRFVTLLVPIALISVVNSTQPFFILLYGWMLAFFFPKIQKEDFSRKALIMKLSAILIMIIGSVLLFV